MAEAAKGKTGIEWVRDPVAVWIPGYNQWVQTLMDVAEGVIEMRAIEIEQWMKANHVWKNRTGLAEQSLFTALVRDAFRVTLIMGHGANVHYSRFLERYMHSGRGDRFSVLKPALDYWSPILLEDLRRSLRS